MSTEQQSPLAGRTAYVLVSGYKTEPALSNATSCRAMTPLIDRPFLQHVVEALVARGVTNVEFVLDNTPDQIESHFGSGERWGVDLRYHLVRDSQQPFAALSWISLPADETKFLLVHADHLQPAAFEAGVPTESNQSYTWHDVESDETFWAGCSWVDRATFRRCADAADRAALEQILTDTKNVARCSTEKPLLGRSFADLVESQQRALAGEFPEVMHHTTQADEGIWIRRNVRLHPHARLVPPVYIDSNCQIDQAVTLGPNVVLGNGCIVDSKCDVQNSMLLPQSYLGEGLHVSDAVVDRQSLFHIGYDVLVSIGDDTIMTGVAEGGLVPALHALFSRGLALLLFVLFSPVFLISVLVCKLTRPGALIVGSDVVRLPGKEGMYSTHKLVSLHGPRRSGGRWGQWRHFILQFLPGLGAIMAGNLRFTGVTPRTIDEMEAMPEDWRALCLGTKAGLITEALVQYGYAAEPEEIHIADAYYAATADFRKDLQLVWRYIKSLFVGPLVARTDHLLNGEAPDSASIDTSGHELANELDECPTGTSA